MLNQYTANALGLPVLTGVTEASSVGNLLCQLYGEGLLKSRKDVKDILKRTYPLSTYMPEDTGKWKEKFEELLKNMKYGNITIIVQDGKIIQIDKTEKHRI